MEEVLFKEKIERLAEVLYCAESSGIATLSQLQAWFHEISRTTAVQSRPGIRTLSLAASRVLEKLILQRLFSSLFISRDPRNTDTPACESDDPGRYSRDSLADLLRLEIESLAGDDLVLEFPMEAGPLEKITSAV